MTSRIFSIVMAGAALLSAAQAVTLVDNGTAKGVIVLPAKTEFEAYAGDKKGWRDEELLAATELQAILARISGATLEIRRAEGGKVPEGPALVIGTELARAAGLSKPLDGLLKDGFICSVKGDKLHLAGRRARGSLYAAYEFLESLGCRWVMPGPFGELYPELKTIAADLDRTANPGHAERYWWCTYGHKPEYELWTLRNKGNFLRTPDDPMVAQGHALSGPLRGGDARTQWLAANKTNALPDSFYALSDGKVNRQVPNMSNPEVWDLYAAHYDDYFTRNSNQLYVSLSAEDGLVDDERPESRALSSLEFDSFIGAPSATDRMWFFFNRVIGKVAAKHPTRKFGILVYSNNMIPPRIERVHPAMALVFAPLSICPLHHVRDPKCKTNRDYATWLRDWMVQAKGAGAETYYYDYEPLGYSWNMAMICPRWAIIGKNYPWFKEMGLTGHTTQGYDDWAASGLNNYLMMRLYWDPTLDYKAVIRDYCKARFGAAADAMEAYYAVYEKRMDEIPDLYSNEVWGNHLVLTRAVRKEARDWLKKAAALADTDRARAQVGAMADLQASTDAMCDALDFADETGDYGKAAVMMEPSFAARDRLNRHYTNFMNSTRTDDKSTILFFTGGIYNQYKAMATNIAAAKASLVLPRLWKGGLDTGNAAFSTGLDKPGADVSKLDELDIAACPDVKYQTQREAVAYFYRAEVKVPAAFKGRRVELYFPGLIARAVQIRVNGEPVTFDHGTYKDETWRGPVYFWMDYDHRVSFDLTGKIKPGQDNVIAIRVFKSFDFGGSYRRPWLLGN
jgi:hypothetical protein